MSGVTLAEALKLARRLDAMLNEAIKPVAKPREKQQ